MFTGLGSLMGVFTLGLSLGLVLVVRSSEWLLGWLGLELNIISFLPLIFKEDEYSAERAVKYFIVQAIASQIFILGAVFLKDYNIFNVLILVALSLKLGVAPFHFWYASVAQGLTWGQNIILMVVQKIGPLHLIFSGLSHINGFVIFLIITSCVVGGLGGLNQNQLRKIIAYSSINHISWTMAAMLNSSWLWLKYYFVYCYIRIFVIYQLLRVSVFSVKGLIGDHSVSFVSSFSFSLLSLGGLPPFLGFIPKWRVIRILSEVGGHILGVFLATFTLISLYFYVRLLWSFIRLVGSKFFFSYRGLLGRGVVINLFGLGLTCFLFIG